MFERFSLRARQVLADAHRHAQAAKRTHIATEHLLLGLVAEPAAGAGSTAEMLQGAGLEPATVLAASREVVSTEHADPASPSIDLAPFGRLLPMTSEARQICRRAFRLTLQHDHAVLGPHHLLASISHTVPDSNAVQMCRRFDVDVAGVHDRAESALVGRSSDTSGDHWGAEPGQAEGELALTPRCRRVLDTARQAARARGHDYLGVEHVMLAILDDADSVATAAIEHSGTALDDVRRAVHEIMASDGYRRATRPAAT